MSAPSRTVDDDAGHNPGDDEGRCERRNGPYEEVHRASEAELARFGVGAGGCGGGNARTNAKRKYGW
jgi:hypothetical protein